MNKYFVNIGWLCCAMTAWFFGTTVPLFANGFLDDDQRTNGKETLGALAGLQSKAAATSVSVGSERDKKMLTGAILSADGYILTKATETMSMKPLRVWFTDGSVEDARLVKRNDKLDLALLKIERTSLSSVTWGESLSLRPAQWLWALSDHGAKMRLGVMSANRRAIANSGAVMGVRFARSDKGDVGVQIEEVATGGPAEQAGLLADDVIMELNSQKVNEPGAVRRVVGVLQPGDLVKVKYKRGGKDGECEVKLASKNRVMMNWGGEDFGNHGTSSRTDNYSEIIQHDLPLDPSDMGGVVYNVQGQAVALNIARVDRVTNYALPVELFLPEVLKWMQEDREKK
ncbi:MAG: S1C family serine protease [Verrucomicrobia bacterium]|nr:S1C family serine protease [Verrucomicrobiota bacterium]